MAHLSRVPWFELQSSLCSLFFISGPVSPAENPITHISHRMMQSKNVFVLLALAFGVSSAVAADQKKRLLRKNDRDGSNADMTEDIAFWTRMTQEVSMPPVVSFFQSYVTMPFQKLKTRRTLRLVSCSFTFHSSKLFNKYENIAYQQGEWDGLWVKYLSMIANHELFPSPHQHFHRFPKM